MNKKRMIVLFASLVVIVGMGNLLISYFPEKAAALMQKGLRYSAGLTAKSLQTENGKIHYLEGGEGPTILFLHGIYARKEHWIEVTRKLTNSYRVILLDLPGFGDNRVMGVGQYSYENQLTHLKMVLDKLKIKEFHIAANSMGAQLGAMIAREPKIQVLSIAFIGGPVGIKSPRQSDMDKALEKGVQPLIVTKEEDFQKRMKWLFPETPFIPGAIIKTWASKEARLAKANKRIWQEVSSSTSLTLQDIAPNLSHPSLILWCTEDRIFDVSGAKVLSSLLPNSKLVIFKDCGHLPMLDKPAMTGATYRNFLDKL